MAEAQDLELEKLKMAKLAKLQEKINKETAETETKTGKVCVNCKGLVTDDLVTELMPGKAFCPLCVIKAATAFVNSKSYMIQIGFNKKRGYAQIKQYDKETNSFGEQKIIDIQKMPVMTVDGVIQFFSAVPIKTKEQAKK
jgi:hypothetical protein